MLRALSQKILHQMRLRLENDGRSMSPQMLLKPFLCQHRTTPNRQISMSL